MREEAYFPYIAKMLLAKQEIDRLVPQMDIKSFWEGGAFTVIGRLGTTLYILDAVQL